MKNKKAHAGWWAWQEMNMNTHTNLSFEQPGGLFANYPFKK
jgi:hypothetical protein